MSIKTYEVTYRATYIIEISFDSELGETLEGALANIQPPDDYYSTYVEGSFVALDIVRQHPPQQQKEKEGRNNGDSHPD